MPSESDIQGAIIPSKFARRMAIIARNGDPEIRHSEADALMKKVLRQLGYEAGVIIFEEMDKWYA